MDGYVIGLDLGASYIKIVTMNSRQNRGEVKRIATPSSEGREAVLDAITRAIEDEIAEQPDPGTPGAICVGTPGLIDEQGTVYGAAVNIKGWQGTPLKKILVSRFGEPLCVLNDVTLTAYGEYRFGAAQDVENMMCISIGSGIGGGIVIDGSLYTGTSGLAAEIGHISVEPEGPPCKCGQYGCLELYSSALGILRLAREKAVSHPGDLSVLVRTQPERVSPELIYEYARKGDPLAMEVHDISSRMLARAVGMVMNLLVPDTIVFTGGVMQSGDLILPGIEKHLPSLSLEASRKSCRIAAGTLGENAGVMGAAGYAMQVTE